MARNPLPPPPSDATLTLNPPLSRPPSNARQRGQWRCDDWGLWFFSPGASPINAFSQNREAAAPRFFLLSCFGPRFPRRGWTPHSCAPLHSDAVFALTGLGNRERRIREPCYSAAVNTILQLRAIFFCCSLCFSFFLFRSLLLLFLRSISRWTGRWKGGERERETNEQQPLRGSCYPRSIGVYSPGVPLQTRFTYPRYIYIYTIFSPVFRLCFSLYDERNATNDLLPVFFLQQKRKEFSFTYVGTYEPHELFARKHDGGVE